MDAEVLMVLAGITLPISGRQVANLYSINRDHVAYPAIEALTDLRGKLYARMAAEVETWAMHPISVAIFGSAARGDGDVNSDIDVLIVPREDLHWDWRINPNEGSNIWEENYQEVWDSQLSEFSSSVRKWSGNSASLIQASPSQLIEMVRRKEPIVASLQMDARYVWGPNIMNSLMDQK